jgi:hypothetical protein
MTCELQPFRVAPLLAPCCGVRGSIKLQPGVSVLLPNQPSLAVDPESHLLLQILTRDVVKHIVILDQNNIRLR